MSFEIEIQKKPKVENVWKNKISSPESVYELKEVKEIKQGKYYLLNDKIYEAEISNQGEEIEQIIYNKSVNIDIEIEKYGFIETQNKDNIFIISKIFIINLMFH